MPGTLFVVATPIGNLEDITARALRVLREVALIAAEDTRRTAHLLARYAITTPTTSLHEHNEATEVGVARRAARSAATASRWCRMPARRPCPIPGAELIRGAIEAGIRVEPIPGPERGAGSSWLHRACRPTRSRFWGFPRLGQKTEQSGSTALRSSGGTVVFFEAPHRIRETLAELQRAVGDCPDRGWPRADESSTKNWSEDQFLRF